MPWPTTSPMQQRLEFIHTVVEHHVAMRTACQQFGISEKTGYKWLQRFLHGGPAALADRSHAPRVAAHPLAPAVSDPIRMLREAHPTWGARKLRQVLETTHPTTEWPAASTITTLLKRAGLVTPRRRRVRDRAAWAEAAGLTPATGPNAVWAADFKGEFRLGTGPECYPLTVSDLYSRFVLGLTGLPGTASLPAQRQFIHLFEHYGLPAVIRTDNGPPFGAPRALGGLSTLAVWWIRLGIRPERIHKGCPQENGSHERMHRTLKAETTRPAAATFAAQQRRFDAWQHTFNTVRPHEALGLTPPATHYVPSPRPYPRRLPPLDYPAHVDLRRVNGNGAIRWHREFLFLSHVLTGEYVGVEETGDEEWTISLGPLRLGYYRTADAAFTDAVTWSPRSDPATLTPTSAGTTLPPPPAPQPALPIISV
jgi:putative transposase